MSLIVNYISIPKIEKCEIMCIFNSMKYYTSIDSLILPRTINTELVISGMRRMLDFEWGSWAYNWFCYAPEQDDFLGPSPLLCKMTMRSLRFLPDPHLLCAIAACQLLQGDDFEVFLCWRELLAGSCRTPLHFSREKEVRNVPGSHTARN